MSIANLKDSGNQGNNMPWQWKMLQGLQAIYDEVKLPLTCVEDSVTICNDNIDAFTFTNILGVGESLNVNIANTIPLEVNITEANDSILVYGWDGATNRKIKTDANGELQVDVLTSPGTFAEDSAHVSGNTGSFVLGVRNDTNAAMTSANGDYSPVAVNANGAVAIQDGGNSITVDGGTGVQRTPTIARTSASSSVAAGAYSVSFASVGTVNATVGGATLKPGETINFDAGAINNTLGAISYDSSAVGAELLIITLT